MTLTRENRRHRERQVTLHHGSRQPSSRRDRVVVTILGSIMLALLAVGLLSRGDRGSDLTAGRSLDARGEPDVGTTDVWKF